MGSVAVLPRVLVHRTPFGTRIEWHQGSGLLARDAAGRCHALGPAELRRCYPEAWPAWVRLAATLPDRRLEPGHSATCGGGGRGGWRWHDGT